MPIPLPITVEADIFQLLSCPAELKETVLFATCAFLSVELPNLYNHFGGLEKKNKKTKHVQCVFQDINKPALSSTCMHFEMTVSAAPRMKPISTKMTEILFGIK